jgi:hypothetical protein
MQNFHNCVRTNDIVIRLHYFRTFIFVCLAEVYALRFSLKGHCHKKSVPEKHPEVLFVDNLWGGKSRVFPRILKEKPGIFPLISCPRIAPLGDALQLLY